MQAGDYSVVELESGVARCPYDPAHNSSSLYVGQSAVLSLSLDLLLICSPPPYGALSDTAIRPSVGIVPVYLVA